MHNTTPLPDISITPIGVKDLVDLGPASAIGEAIADVLDTPNPHAAQVKDLVARWLGGGWQWYLEGTHAVTLLAVSRLDPRITLKHHFDRGAYEESEIVLHDHERGVYFVVSDPPGENRDIGFGHAPLHRLADAMIAMDVVLPLGVAEKIAGDRISEVRS